MPQLEEMFQALDERLVAVLGEEEAQRFRMGEPVRKSLLVLTDQRLYHRGVFYRVRPGTKSGQLRRGGFALPTKDLGPSLLMKQQVFRYLALGLLYAAFGGYFGVRAVMDSGGVFTNSVVCSLMLAALVIGFGIFDICKYFRNRGIELYVLVTRRGGLGVDVAWHTREEIERFQDKLASLVGDEYGN